MRYIRTKDGEIIDTNNIEILESWFDDRLFKEIIKKRWIAKTEIIDQADTIEELCDEFVRVRNDIHDFLVSDDIPDKLNGWIIYGAIWTNKGLIYVAKMNDKGELELL